MIYVYYNKKSSEIIMATNVKAISDRSEISYSKLSRWFRNGTVIKETDEYIILKGEPIKGKQRAPESSAVDSSPKQTKSFFDEIMK